MTLDSNDDVINFGTIAASEVFPALIPNQITGTVERSDVIPTFNAILNLIFLSGSKVRQGHYI